MQSNKREDSTPKLEELTTDDTLEAVTGGLLWENMRPSTNVIDMTIVCSIWDYQPGGRYYEP